jgi:hypothetical protein
MVATLIEHEFCLTTVRAYPMQHLIHDLGSPLLKTKQDFQSGQNLKWCSHNGSIFHIVIDRSLSVSWRSPQTARQPKPNARVQFLLY